MAETPGERARRKAREAAANADGGNDQIAGHRNTGATPDPAQKPLYIGVEAGSDLEQYGYQTNMSRQLAPQFQHLVPFGGGLPKKPKYKVGYLNSEDFSKELGDLDKDVIYQYQQRMFEAGIIESFDPGKLDKATRAGFKELITQANQQGATWQSMLQLSEQTGGKVSADQGRAPLVVELTNPDDIRNTVRHVAGQLYGGSLPDSTTEAIVNAVRDQETAAQTTAYNLSETGGTVTKPGDVQNLAEDTIRKEHPNEVAATQFADMFDSILSTMNTSPSNYQGIKYP